MVFGWGGWAGEKYLIERQERAGSKLCGSQRQQSKPMAR